jgi:hypothetical protein
MKSVYEECLEAGVPMDNHASDLYIPVNEITQAILDRHPERSRTIFTNQNDGKQWFDVTLAFEPWWDERANRTTKI